MKAHASPPYRHQLTRSPPSLFIFYKKEPYPPPPSPPASFSNQFHPRDPSAPPSSGTPSALTLPKDQTRPAILRRHPHYRPTVRSCSSHATPLPHRSHQAPPPRRRAHHPRPRANPGALSQSRTYPRGTRPGPRPPLDAGRKSRAKYQYRARDSAPQRPRLRLLVRGPARHRALRLRHSIPAGHRHGRHLGCAPPQPDRHHHLHRGPRKI